ncbi:hypothetical protein [Marinibactrum halimedae]|uniref:Uncharacterized protein n=1 Tax=Marinibactrum halimedae TaxID=1444977 RepID=A0AA37T8H3_9GAMM|nr:hypothetical protein [Marinibactrum halimedae]MCD9459033.1 hypothetical protein [Marinibactrum halimedae]GLS26837.1 hypothetical protein GCM10007877_25560 [Marinibactrum halimedae]
MANISVVLESLFRCGHSEVVVAFDNKEPTFSIERHNGQFQAINENIKKNLIKFPTIKDVIVIVGAAHLEKLKPNWEPHHEKLDQPIYTKNLGGADVYCYTTLSDNKPFNYDDSIP